MQLHLCTGRHSRASITTIIGPKGQALHEITCNLYETPTFILQHSYFANEKTKIQKDSGTSPKPQSTNSTRSQSTFAVCLFDFAETYIVSLCTSLKQGYSFYIWKQLNELSRFKSLFGEQNSMIFILPKDKVLKVKQWRRIELGLKHSYVRWEDTSI